MAKVRIKPTTTMFPLPVMLVTCVDAFGKPISLPWPG